MARRQYQSIREERFLRGIDARSAENEIQAGYVRDALNTDLVQGYASKRAGYAGYAGNVPVRVTSVDWNQADQEICFTLDTAVSASAVDLSNVRSSPLVVYGRLSGSNTAGTFNQTDSGKWYPGFYQKIRRTFLTGTHTLVIPGTEHGLGTANLFLQVVQSESQTNLSNRLVEYGTFLGPPVDAYQGLTIDEITYDITIPYTNSTGSDIEVFVYYARKDAVSGSVYVASPFSVLSGATSTQNISAATHGLANFQIIARVYRDDGTTRELVIPETLTVNQTTGQVSVTIHNDTGSTQNYVTILSTVPVTNVTDGEVIGDTYTATIEAPSSPFLFPGVYIKEPGNILSQVIPDEVVYNAATNTVEITFPLTEWLPLPDPIPPGYPSLGFTILWDTGEIRSTQICVEDTSVVSDGSDDRPQLTIWGLDHTELYGSDRQEGEGWVNHIDSYRISGENRIVCGLGGNLFTARERAELSIQYRLVSAYPSLFARTSALATVGPVFSPVPGRTRGYIGGTGLSDGWATITAVEYDTGNEWTRYDLTIPSMSINGTLSVIISTTSGSEDYLTTSDMPYSRHNGVYKIRQVQASGNVLSLWVENPEVYTADWNDDGCAGFGGIFTDRIELNISSPFIPGDTILSSAVPASLELTVLGTSSVATNSVTVDGCVENLTIPSGVLLAGQRTSPVIPIRDLLDTATTENFVRGDMVELTGFNRPFRVLHCHTDQSRTVNITSDGTTATAVMVSPGITDTLSPGQQVLLVRAGVYTGTQTISEIVSLNSFTFLSGETISQSGTLLGHTLELGEEIEWSDSVDDSLSISVPRRWIPVEAPDDNDALTPSTYVQHLVANAPTSQPPLRSVMVQDNMYLTNGDDPVQRFDGVNISRAGIPAWQPGLFLLVDTAAAAAIVVPDDLSATPSALVGTRFTVPVGTEQQFPVGSTIRYSDTTPTEVDLTVTQSYATAASGFIHVQKISGMPSGLGGTPLIRRLSVYRYYYRLNAVDINGNVVASATAQSDDYTVVLEENAAIKHKLVGLPIFDNYDYDSLYLQVYRTRGDTAAPYYRVYQTRLEYAGADGYVEFVDTLSDISLTDLDPVNSSLKGAELGIGWQAPLRSKYVTTAANSLVLANFADYPVMDLQFIAPSSYSVTNPAGTLLTFRRDSASSGAVTDMSNVVRYEARNVSAAVPVTTYALATGGFSVVVAPPTIPNRGDWVYLFYDTVATTGRNTDLTGWWQVTNQPAGGSPWTIEVKRSNTVLSSLTAPPNQALFATDKRDVPVAVGTDGNYGTFTGNSSQSVFQLGRRLSLAINASMRMVDKTIPAMSAFTPWLAARGGNDTAVAGRVTVAAPVSEATTPEVELTTLSSQLEVFVNDTQFSAGTSVPADIRLFPSRILVSYENFPEIFDTPTAVLDSESDSAIDINPSDGQEITGVVPFFGDSAFGAAQKSGVVVVFKQNSVYLIDINEKRAGRPAVQRLETEGIGCTAPGSISVTAQGIMFANESGIYALRRDLTVEFVGEYMDRNWVGRVNRSRLDLAVGHHYTVGRRYKLSVPLIGETNNSEVYVYDHTNERELGRGSWGRYDNHPATGWCNLLQDAFFAASDGRVYIVRRNGDKYDYQDDNQAITMNLQTRPNSFGVTNTRKVVDSFVIGYRTGVPSESTLIGTAIDTDQQYTATTSIRIKSPIIENTGTADLSGRDVVSVFHTTSRRRGIYFSVQIQNSEYCEAVQVASLEYSVGTTGAGRGITGAAQTPGKSGT